MSQSGAIVRFAGPYHFLSNFFIEKDGSHVEGEFQARKTDPPTWDLCDMNPVQAKKAGQHLVLRADWEDVKVQIMAELLHEKFKEKGVRQMLLGTGYADLVEGNYWDDTFWGVCRNEGRNWMGLLLMNEREEIRRS
jgi:hypothetical protein